jgi:hypothetical protein
MKATVSICALACFLLTGQVVHAQDAKAYIQNKWLSNSDSISLLLNGNFDLDGGCDSRLIFDVVKYQKEEAREKGLGRPIQLRENLIKKTCGPGTHFFNYQSVKLPPLASICQYGYSQDTLFSSGEYVLSFSEAGTGLSVHTEPFTIHSAMATNKTVYSTDDSVELYFKVDKDYGVRYFQCAGQYIIDLQAWNVASGIWETITNTQDKNCTMQQETPTFLVSEGKFKYKRAEFLKPGNRFRFATTIFAKKIHGIGRIMDETAPPIVVYSNVFSIR